MTWSDAGPTVLEDPWRARRRRGAAHAPPRSSSLSLGVAVDVDATFGFLMFMAMLFASQLGTVSAAFLLLVTPLYALLQRKRLWGVLWPRTLLLVPALIAGLSVFWSEAPGESAKFAVEYGVTILGALLLAGARNPHNVLRALMLAFGIYLGVSLAFGHSTAVGNDGGSAFSGLTNGKNLLGDIAASGLLIGLGVFVTSLPRKRWLWASVAVAVTAVALFALVVSRSAGALMGLVFGVAGLLALLSVMRAPVAVRTVLFGFISLCLVLGLVFQRWLAAQLLDMGSHLLDKDATLTGRTYLWYRAQDLIDQKPALGHGFQAFWLQGNVDAEGLWRYAGITTRGGFTFHNTLIEALVQLGWVGTVALMAVVATVVWMLISRCVKGPTVSLCVWMGVLFYELVRTPVEAIGLAPLYFSTVLTIMALGFALGRPIERPRSAAARAHGPQPLRVVAVRVLEPQTTTRRLLLAPPREP